MIIPGIPATPDYNVSHHGSYVGLTIAPPSHRPTRLGIDITEISPIPNPNDPATRASLFLSYFDEQFSPSEWAWIRAAQSEFEAIKRFHCMWALKEAYTKGVGCGIVVDLRQVVFHIADFRPTSSSFIRIWDTPLSVTLTVKGVLMNQWSFQVSLIDDTHIVCIAANPPIADPVKIQRLQWSDVLSDIGITQKLP
eukprot:jgi/Hompol1/6576/HPOL_002495-RA